jgi:biopolymer transport protein ExbB
MMHPRCVPAAIALVALYCLSHPAFAQDPADAGPAPLSQEEAARLAEQVLAAQPSQNAGQESSQPPPAPEVPAVNLLELQLKGGWWMLPIGFMAILVVTFGIERGLALRRRKILPPELVDSLGELAEHKGGLDPRKAYRLCQEFPSAASNVIRSTLLKVGRPHSEVEHAVAEACEREAAKLYANVRPINLATAVSPLLGLMGTIVGMIYAFAQTASGVAGANKAEQLAGGIYVALVTTFAGLCVAIPGAILAHYFEGRIQALFREVDELLLGILPQLERYEGRLRVSRSERGLDESPAEEPKHRRGEALADKAKPAATEK